jgi:hypothetical protein
VPPDAIRVPTPRRGGVPLPPPRRARLLEMLEYELCEDDWASTTVLVPQMARLALGHAHELVGRWDRMEALVVGLRDRTRAAVVTDADGEQPLWAEVDDEASSLTWGGVEWGSRFTMRLLALCPTPDLLPRDQLASVMASAM